MVKYTTQLYTKTLDMGLGKTLQTICILAGDIYERAEKFKIDPKEKPLPALVVCPTTVTGHWYHEILKFTSSDILKPLIYIGSSNKRAK